ncbi:MAG: hypothetical protein K0S47_701 [Herbinix sp.]|nr:hypothetical protein [Herbinix sp.]
MGKGGKRKSECISKMKELQRDLREDEAILEKVKMNIYDIFTKVFEAQERRGLGKGTTIDPEKYQAFLKDYLQCFVNIPEPWRKSLNYAREQGQLAEAAIEEVKLEIADSIKSLFKLTFDMEGI